MTRAERFVWTVSGAVLAYFGARIAAGQNFAAAMIGGVMTLGGFIVVLSAGIGGRAND